MQRCNGPHPDDKIVFGALDMMHVMGHSKALRDLAEETGKRWFVNGYITTREIEELYEELNKIKDHVDARVFEIMSGDTMVKVLHSHGEGGEKQCD